MGQGLTKPHHSDLTNKVIVVTGGASGIGKATVKCCAERGASVVLGDLSSSDGHAVAATHISRGRPVRFVPTDVTVEAQCQKMIQTAVDAYGYLDVLICCAGILEGAMVDIANFDDDIFQHVMDVNVRGAFLCVKHAVAVMDKRPGTILLIASRAGVQTGSTSIAYGTSKAGLHGLGTVLQHHLAERPFRINTVCPGNIATPLKVQNVTDAGHALGQSADNVARKISELGDPDGIARVLAFLASDDAAFVRGTIFTR